jgi:hypothetical protein
MIVLNVKKEWTDRSSIELKFLKEKKKLRRQQRRLNFQKFDRRRQSRMGFVKLAAFEGAWW